MASKQANNKSGALEQGELSKPEIFQLLQKQKELGLPVEVRIANRSLVKGLHTGLGNSSSRQSRISFKLGLKDEYKVYL